MCKIEYVECKDCECWNQNHSHTDSNGSQMGICVRHAPRPMSIIKQYSAFDVIDAEGDETKAKPDKLHGVLFGSKPMRVICTTLYNEGCFEGLYKKGLREEREQEHKQIEQSHNAN